MSTKNTIEDLRNHMFDTIDLLKEKKIDISDAKAITNACQTILNSAKVEVDFIKVMGGIGEGTGFIPLEPMKPDMKALSDTKDEDGDALTFSWIDDRGEAISDGEKVLVSLNIPGEHKITVIADDDHGGLGYHTTAVTISDTTINAFKYTPSNPTTSDTVKFSVDKYKNIYIYIYI